MKAEYLNLSDSQFQEIINKLNALFKKCAFCGHKCGVNRTKNQTGVCGVNRLKVNCAQLHFGEEPPVSASAGSGTVFFSGCSLNCVYCQNYTISYDQKGKFTDGEGLAEDFLKLQKEGAANINLVTPTHFLNYIAAALFMAKKKGLFIPVVYNTSCYETKEALSVIDPLIDVYLPDFKYANEKCFSYSGVKNYFNRAKENIKFMIEEKGALKLNAKGAAQRGVLVRHLALPGRIENTIKVIQTLASISKDITLSLMSQYTPCHKAFKYPNLARKINFKEYSAAVSEAEKHGFHDIFIQDMPDEKTTREFLGVNFL